MGMQATPVTESAEVDGQRIYVNAAGRVADVLLEDGTLDFAVTYMPPQTGYVAVVGLSAPTAVLVDGETAAEVVEPATSDAPCYRYLPDLKLLELRLGDSGRHAVRVEGVHPEVVSITPAPATSIAFEFSNDADGWRPARDLGPFRVSEGVLHSDTTGPDPYMIRGACRFGAETVQRLRIRMALGPGVGSAAQCFWATEQEPDATESKSVQFGVIPDGEFHEYVVPLTGHPRWTGNVTMLRLDPTGGLPTGEVRIDYIRGE